MESAGEAGGRSGGAGMRTAQVLGNYFFGQRRLLAQEEAFTKNQGPVFVMVLDPGEFQLLHRKTSAYRCNLLYIKESSRLYVQDDHSLRHEGVRQFWLNRFIRFFDKAGVATDGDRLVECTAGGLVEYRDRFQQVDLLVLERSPGESVDVARVVLVGQLVYENEDVGRVVADLEAVTSRENCGSRFALVIQLHKNGLIDVWVKERGSPVEKIDREGALRIDWRRLFEVPEVLREMRGPGVLEISVADAVKYASVFFD